MAGEKKIKHDFSLSIKTEGAQSIKEVNDRIAELEDELVRAKDKADKLNRELKNIKDQGAKTAFDDIAKAIKKLSTSQEEVNKNLRKYTKYQQDSTKNVVKGYEKQAEAAKKATSVQEHFAKKTAESQKRAYDLLGVFETKSQSSLYKDKFKLSDKQIEGINKQLDRWDSGKIDQGQFTKNVSRISKQYAKEFSEGEITKSMSKSVLQYQLDLEKEKNRHNEKLSSDKTKFAEKEANAYGKIIESEEKTRNLNAINLASEKERVKAAQEIAKSEKQIAAEKAKQEKNKTDSSEAKAAKDRAAQKQKEFDVENHINDVKEKAAAQELRRQQKLKQNEEARLAVQQKLREVVNGTGQVQSVTERRAETSIKRLKETMENLQKFAATKGYTGTTGLESTSYLRVQQYAKYITEAASEWKKVNSAEGKAAATLGRVIYDVDRFRKGIGMIHTSLGQVASALGAIRGIGQTIRKGLQQTVQYIGQAVSQLTSSALTSSLEALKDLELSEIGFSNFFGEESVSGIISQVKQEALTSPLSATQLASYINQLAPLSNGNSNLTIDAAMGIAKMIQYSGGEVSTEMEYVVKNLRDVMSKGTATTVDIRQFNRAMPALEQVLKEMGLTEFLDESEATLSITKENASQMLEAFQKINDSDTVGTIFDKTSQTLSGLMERLEEQIQLMVIDVGDFSGLTDLIKGTLYDLLEDTDGWIEDIKMKLQFVFYDITRWLKSRDWDRILEDAKEIFNILKTGISEALAGLKKALGGTDMASTIKALTEALTSFLQGMINSYSWIIDIVKDLNNSGVIGSSISKLLMTISGFMSGGAGALITGLTRGIGNAIGVFNQLTLAVQNVMKSAQLNLANAAAEVSTFGEALAIVTQIMPELATDITLINEMLAGNMTAEEVASKAKIVAQKAETAASELVTKAKQAEAQASELAAAADEGEATASTASGGSGILSSLFGSGKGTKIGGALTKILGGVVAGNLLGTLFSSISGGISSAAGADDLTSKNVSAGFGNITSGLAAGGLSGAAIGSIIPGIGTAIGAGVGAIVGAISGIAGTVSDIKSNQEEANAEELAALESEINSGDYARQKLEELTNGKIRVTDDQFDELNSKYVQQMNQFNDTFPNGTAEMLKEYLKSIEGEVNSTNGILAVSDKEYNENADALWTLVSNDEIDRANEYAQGLYDIGYSTADVTSMLLMKANEVWEKDEDKIQKIQDLILKWGDVQTESGTDLTLDYLNSLKSGSESDQSVAKGIENELYSLYLDMGKDMVANTTLSDSEKAEIAKNFANAFVKYMTGAIDEISAEEKFSMTRLLTEAGITDAESLGLTQTFADINRILGVDGAVEKYGIQNNWELWASDFVGTFNEEWEKAWGGEEAKQGIAEIAQKYYDALGDESKAEEVFDKIGAWSTEFKNKISEGLDVSNETNNFNTNMWTMKDSIDSTSSSIKTLNNNALKLNLSTNLLQTKLNNLENNSNNNNKYNGGLIYRATGGGVRGVDTVPAMLQRGEFVVRKSAVEKFGLTALNALNTGNTSYFARALGRQNIYGDYSNARTWNSTSNDNRKSVKNVVKVYNKSKGARMNRYYSLANRLA